MRVLPLSDRLEVSDSGVKDRYGITGSNGAETQDGTHYRLVRNMVLYVAAGHGG